MTDSGLLERLDGAIGRYAQAETTLYREDGQPLYTDHTARVAALREDLAREFEAADAEFAALREMTTRELEQHAGGDTLSLLSVEELSLANARIPFVERAVALYAPQDYVTRLTSVKHIGDRADMYLWAQEGEKLYQGIMKARSNGTRYSDADINAARQVWALVGELRTKLDPDRATRKQVLEQRREDLTRLQIEINNRRVHIIPKGRSRGQL